MMGGLTVREVGLVNPGKIRLVVWGGGGLRDLGSQFSVTEYDCQR